MSHSHFKAPAFLLLTLLPVLFIFVGFWQFYRANDDIVILDAVEARINLLHEIQDDFGRSDIIVGLVGEETFRTDEELKDLETIKEYFVGKYPGSLHARLVVAKVGIGLGGLSLLAGLGCLAFISFAAQKKMVCNEDAILSLQADLKKIPWIVCGLVVLFGITFISLLGFEIFSSLVLNRKNEFDGFIVVLGGAVILGLLYAYDKYILKIFKIIRESSEDFSWKAVGHVILPDDSRELWELVRSVAKKVGATPPDTIVVGMESLFFVSEGVISLSDNDSQVIPGRTLYLPLVYLVYMSREEVSAMIGHELAHYAENADRLAIEFLWQYRLGGDRGVNLEMAILEYNSLSATAIIKCALAILRAYLHTVLEATSQWRRERELAADKAAYAVAGAENFASALCRVNIFEIFNAMAFMRTLDDSLGDKSFFEHFHDIVADPPSYYRVQYLSGNIKHPVDFHDSVEERLAALGVNAEEIVNALGREDFFKTKSSFLNDMGLDVEEMEKAFNAADLKRHQSESSGADTVANTPYDAISINDAPDNELIHTFHGKPRTGLETVLEDDSETGVIYEKASLLGLACVGVIFIALAVLYVFENGKKPVPLWIIILTACLGVMMVFVVLTKLKRRNQPVLRLKKEGFFAGSSKDIIPWRMVDDFTYSAVTTYGVVVQIQIKFVLAEQWMEHIDFPKRGYIACNYEKRTLVISLINVRKPYTLESLQAEIDSYWKKGRFGVS